MKLIVLENLSTTTLKKGLCLFCENYGFPSHVWSDNGTNFPGFKVELQKMSNAGEIEKIVWKMSTPFAPWNNGLSERTTKNCFTILSMKSRSLFEVSRKFQEIEKVINHRTILQADGKVYSAFELSRGRMRYPTKENKDFSIPKLFENRNKFVEEVSRLWMIQYLKHLAKVDHRKITDLKD